MKTKVYHISYAPVAKEATIFFWGCNFRCRGCLCQKQIYNFLLKENLDQFRAEPTTIASPPQVFLEISEIVDILKTVELERVYLEGQEAGIDPEYGELTKTLHSTFGCQNHLLTNGFEIPNIQNTDKIAFGIKAITDNLHKEYTGQSNVKVLQNFKRLYNSGIKLAATSVFIPEYIALPEIEKIAQFIASVDKQIPYVMLPYLKAGHNPWRRPNPLEMAEAVSVAKRYLENVHGWGGDETMEYELVRLF
ncbi:radical SAM protein [Dehalogenimonas etheniformans]|uniref:Radical SAM protein n=1 Tax=Dehalogenimonas etheniformans TaxID=1536648 RepID=A0A2P5PA44_9CHLR|nr:radical SAM protein [Dehalogenimonas etheniformans]PPD59183.1 radical SAM protein [Dehalogenimonas etheniformans]QNT75774.1 radical SAM protein [Dehalogenimonas etheniformans]